VERIAVLRFENLGSHASDDWMGRAFSEVIGAGLSGIRGVYAIGSGRLHGSDNVFGQRPPTAPGISTERALAIAARADRVVEGYYWLAGGRVEARLAIEDPRTGKTVRTASASAPGVIQAASELARQIHPGAVPYAVRSPQALQKWAASLEERDPASASRDAEDAIAADPGFPPAYERLAQLKAVQGDRAGAASVLERALAGGRFGSAPGRARIQVQLAELRGDADARRVALAELARLEPSDPFLWRSLAGAEMDRHAFEQAAAAYRKALEIEPEEGTLLNQLGYALAYAGDFTAAVDALGRYRALSPAEPNPLDSLGDVNLMAGRLREAEGYYSQAAQKSPNFMAGGEWLKAAMARLMTGDVSGADALHKHYLEERAAANDPSVPYRDAEWQWIAGRRELALRNMEAYARGAAGGPLREMAARAYAQLAVWRAAMGDRDIAAQASRKALSLAGPSPTGIVALAAFLTAPPSGGSPAGGPAGQDLAVACRLLLDRQFQPAAGLLARLYSAVAPGNEEGLPVMLAWAYLETGRTPDAARLLRLNPIPSAAGVSPLSAFFFPRIYSLRALASEKEGRRDEAAANLRLFRRLSGSE
jgi:Flp pilus assembly protein TadD